MKKISVIFFGLACWQMSFAQITIDGSNFINPGTSLDYENASPIWLVGQNLIDTDGENAVWNVDDWQSTGNTLENYGSLDTLSFLIQLTFANQLLNPDVFSTVVLSVGTDLIDFPLPLDISEGYSYFRNDETGYYNTGTSFSLSGIPVSTPNDEVERIYKFPMHYADTDTSSLAYFISLPTLGSYGQSGTRYSEVDGSGVLNTPYGSYDVLRVKSIRHITDTLFIDQIGSGQSIPRPEQIDYAWLSPNVDGPVLKMSVIAGAVVSAQLLNDSLITGLSENSKSELAIYPNPAQQFITIKTDGKPVGVKIFTATGRLVLTQKSNFQRIDIGSLSPGIYFVQVAFSRKEATNQKLLITE